MTTLTSNHTVPMALNTAKVRAIHKRNRKCWYTWYRCMMHMTALRAAIAAVKMQDVSPFDF